MEIKKLLNILCCPKCKGILDLNTSEDRFTCLPCQLAYPVRDGIPIMLVDEALPLSE